MALSPWRQVRKPLRPDEHLAAKAPSLTCPIESRTVLALPFRVRCPFSIPCYPPHGDSFPPPKTCYNQASGILPKDMRIAIRLLAILMIAALLAPGVRWACLRTSLQTCACAPAACMCAGHHHAFGHAHLCGMANGGRCGLGSYDSYLSSILSILIYFPTEHVWSNPLAPWTCGHETSELNLLPSHAQIPEQPPRITL